MLFWSNVTLLSYSVLYALSLYSHSLCSVSGTVCSASFTSAVCNYSAFPAPLFVDFNNNAETVNDQTVKPSTGSRKLGLLCSTVQAGTVPERPELFGSINFPNTPVKSSTLLVQVDATYNPMIKSIIAELDDHMACKLYRLPGPVSRLVRTLVARVNLKCRQNLINKSTFRHYMRKIHHVQAWYNIVYVVSTNSCKDRVLITFHEPEVRCRGAGPVRPIWTPGEINTYSPDIPLTSEKYKFVSCILPNLTAVYLIDNPDYIFVDVPLRKLCSKLSLSRIRDVCALHGIFLSRHNQDRQAVLACIAEHVCQDCPSYKTVLCPSVAVSPAERKVKSRAKKTADDLRTEWREEYHKKAQESGFWAKRKSWRKHSHKNHEFPPEPPSPKLIETVIRDWCHDCAFENIEEYGCVVCGALTANTDLRLFKKKNYNLDCLKIQGVTRKERLSATKPIVELGGPVLASHCDKICRSCHTSLSKNEAPSSALANGCWLGEVPQVLKDLSWTEQRLIARVMHNYCIVRVFSGSHKMRANAICHSIPMPKVYKVLPPPREDLDEILAFIYVGPSTPTAEDYKRTPFLIRRNKVAAALEWLKLNHVDYEDIDISYDNLNKYPEDEPPVVVDFHQNDTGSNRDPEAIAVNDNEEEEGTEEDDCPFVVHNLTTEQYNDWLTKEKHAKVKAKALQHFKAGNKVLAIGHSNKPESLYNNPQLYPQMFPWLFPYGYGGLGNARGYSPISDAKRKRQLLMYYDKRFQLDRSFALIAFNHEQIKNSSTGGFLLAKRKDIATVADRLLNLNANALDDIINRMQKNEEYVKPQTAEEKECYDLLKDLDYVNSHVDGSITNRKQMRSEIWALTSYLGAPSWFITFAPADVNHPIALYFADTNQKIMPTFKTRDDRLRLIAQNPVAGARFFKMMSELFIKHVLGVKSGHRGIYGNTAGYYGTVEQQGRLTLHMHMLIWIKNALTPQEIRERVLDPKSEFQRRMVEYLESVRVGEFLTGTMSEVNDNIQDAEASDPDRISPTLTLPTPPPDLCHEECEKCDSCKAYERWWIDYHKTVDELIFRSNKHTCGPGCEVIVKVGKKIVKRCRARFPRDTRVQTLVDPDSGYLLQKKGEAWINWLTPPATFLFRCNTDVTSLLSGTSIKAVTSYVTDYITKQSLKTHTIFEAVRTILSRNSDILTDDTDKQVKARKLITKVVNALTGKSEIGGPMAAMYLLKHPDHYTPFKFRKFYWYNFVSKVENYWHKGLKEASDGREQLNEKLLLWEKNAEYFGVSMVEDYMYRPSELTDMTLYDWVRLATKSTIPRKLSEKLINGEEHAVKSIISHEWKGRRVKFHVQWHAGDTTWESYTACSHLHAMDVYLKHYNVKNWKDLPREAIDVSSLNKSAYKDVDDENDQGEIDNINMDDDQNEEDNEDNMLDTKWYFFSDEHPQSKTHRIRIATAEKSLVPNFKGRPLPRRDQGNREDYCMTMLTLFKPWRNPAELKTKVQIWEEAFDTYTFSSRQKELMKFFQVRYECNDARDDYSAQLKSGKIMASDMPVNMSSNIIKNLDDGSYYGNEPFADMADEDIEAMVTEYGHLSKAERDMLNRMDQAERLMVLSGALDIVNDTSFKSIEREDGKKQSGQQWHQSLLDVRDKILLQRRDQANGTTADGADDSSDPSKSSTDRYKNVVKVVDQSYLTRSFKSNDQSVQPMIDEIVTKFTLNTEQARAFKIVANHSTTKNNEQLRMHLGGMAGTGKSRVINALRYWFAQRNEEYRMICLAPTGAAAALINGSTYHSVLGINQYSIDRESVANLAEVHDNLRNVDYVFIDEISMLDCWSLYQISKKMCQAMKNDDEPFGGIHMILAGDFAQLSPPGRKFSLYSDGIDGVKKEGNGPHKQECTIGKSLWHQFTTVVILRQNMRQTSSSAEDLKFRQCLENLRYKSCTDADIALLKKRITGPGEHRPKLTDVRFRNVSIITRWNAYRDKINEVVSERFAKEHGQTLQTFYSLDQWRSNDESKRRGRKKTVVDPLRQSNNIPPSIQNLIWNLPHARSENHPGKLRLCIGLPVMIKKNIATECGVTNGAEGIVVGWKVRPIDKDHMGLETVFVQLTALAKSFTIEGLPENVVPIQYRNEQIKLTMPNGIVQHVDREQVPLVPNFAMTDYCSQGRTRIYNVVDLQNCADHQSIYTTLSRAVNYSGTVLIQSFDESKLKGGISGYLRQEFRELELLDEITRLKFEQKLPTKVTGDTRGFLIYLYRKWMGVKYIPTNVPKMLRWSDQEPFYMQKPVVEAEWEVIKKKTNGTDDRDKTTKKTKTTKSTQNKKPVRMVVAKGTHTLHEDKKTSGPPLVDNTVSHKRPRPIEDDDNNLIPHKKITQINPSRLNLNPIGFVWDNINYSCAYDSLFSILKNWSDKTGQANQLITACDTHYVSDFIHYLDQARAHMLPLETVRDYVREDLHQTLPETFPYGTVGTSVAELCTELFKEKEGYGTWINQCQGCNRQSNVHRVKHMTWYCSRAVYNQSIKRGGTYRTLTSSEWIDAIRASRADRGCRNCEGTIVRKINFNKMPATILMWIENVKVKWEQCITLENTQYQLVGLVYFGSFHFTARIIDKDGSIWYHDGVRTGRQCVYEGNLNTTSYQTLAKARNSRICIAALYIQIYS